MGSCLPQAGPNPGHGALELFIVSVPSLGRHVPLRAAAGDTMSVFCGPGESIRIFHRLQLQFNISQRVPKIKDHGYTVSVTNSCC